MENHLWAYYLLNIIKMTKSCKARWTGYAAHIRVMRNICRFWAGKLEVKKSFQRPTYIR
jgi:hypothetical protein